VITTKLKVKSKSRSRTTKKSRFTTFQWSIPVTSIPVSFDYSFPEAGSTYTVNYEPTEAAIQKVTSIDCDISAAVPTSVRFTVVGDGNTQYLTVPITASMTVRHVALRMPRYVDYSTNTSVLVYSDGPAKITGIARFSSKNVVQTDKTPT
jgi:hypothetical protein